MDKTAKSQKPRPRLAGRSIGQSLCAALALGSLSQIGSADTVAIGPAKDATLVEDFLGILANGAGQHLFCGKTNQGFLLDRRRTLMKFDIASAVPEGSTINSVTLTLYMSRSAQAGPTNVSIRPVLADWGEGTTDPDAGEGPGVTAQPGDCTWFYSFYPTIEWMAQGGDFVAGPGSATTLIGGINFYSWSSPQLAVEVQGWLDDPSSNFGWIMIGNESMSATAKRFDSRQHPDPSRRPRLMIDFTPPAASGACCLPDGACLILTATQCAAQRGVYQGNDTTCDPNPCPQPPGACCLTDASCKVLTEKVCAKMGGAFQGALTDCGSVECAVVLEPFVDPLPIPPIAQPVRGEPGAAAEYEITVNEFEQQLHRDLPPTRLWGYAGMYPGPTIVASRGQQVSVTWISDLRDERGQLRTEHLLPVDLCVHGPSFEGNNPRTVVHLHGGHVPAEYDGYPELTILPGESQTFVYPNQQPAATLWYHDHALGITRLNVWLGLAGVYIVRDRAELGLNLPAGEFDLPLIIQDRSFNADGSLRYPAAWQEMYFGDTMLVNGKVWPYMNVKQGKYRFRALNGSNSRTLTLSLSNGRPFSAIATDGGLLEAPVSLTEITLAPAERADLIIDFESLAPGTEVILMNSASAPLMAGPGVGVIPNVIKFIVQAEPGFTGAIPASLVEIEQLQEADAVVHRDFELRMAMDECVESGIVWLINGMHWDHIMERPRLGTTEVWSFINRSAMMHPMHMHLVQFQVLDRQDFMVVGEDIIPVGDPIPPPPEEAGWKDTVRAMPNQITRVIARFEDYTGKFAYHCHILEHEDHEMMRQFEAVPAVTGDLNNDGVVNGLDLGNLLANWSIPSGAAGCEGSVNCPSDINHDGVVDGIDLASLLDNWTFY